MRNVPIVEGEYYHVFNRGVEKRDIFLDTHDVARFLESIRLFNSDDVVGSIFEHRHSKNRSFGSSTPKSTLVDIVCYCLNPNHFHLLLYQKSENGIQRFMQKIGTGYTNYFNEKYKRSGGLFQGKYKSVHIESNEQLLHTSVYVNLNNRFGSSTPKLSTSSWGEFLDREAESASLCKPDVILEQFKTTQDYTSFAESSLAQIIERKMMEKEMVWLFAK